MIFVSKYGAYRIVALHETYDRLNQVGRGDGYTCEFRADVIEKHMELLRSEERAGRLKFNGTPRDAQTNQDRDPAERCSTFDSEWIPDPDQRKKVEAALLSNPDFGKAYWLFVAPHAAAPYPKYDEHRKVHGRRSLEHAIQDITAAYEAVGFDIDQAIQYENENGANAEIVAALEALKPEPVEEELVAA